MLAAVWVCAQAALGVTPGIKNMGATPVGNKASSWAIGVSPDGTAVVGRFKLIDSPYTEMGYVWKEPGGMVNISDLPGNISITELNGVSANGAVGVGLGYGTSSYYHAAYTSGGQNVDMGTLSGSEYRSWASGVSANGSVIAGTSDSSQGTFAFRWTAAGGMVSLGDFAGGIPNSSGNAISADGTTVVGFGTIAGYSGIEAFRWRAGTGMVELGWLNLGSGLQSEATGVSRDGSVVVGHAWYTVNYNTFEEAFIWNEHDGMVGLGSLAPDNGTVFLSRAYGVSGDGKIVVGASAIQGGGHTAMVWDAAHGMRSLSDYLHQECDLNMAGWNLSVATAISDDGHTIVAMGTGPYGPSNGWVITIPEPASLSLLGLGGLAAIRRRR